MWENEREASGGPLGCTGLELGIRRELGLFSQEKTELRLENYLTLFSVSKCL